MKKKTRAILVTVILVATVGVVIVGMASFIDPYLSVDTIVENPDAYVGRQIQVRGALVPGTYVNDGQNITFYLTGDNHSIFVILEGEQPENMLTADYIIAVGVMESVDIIRASQVLAKCPSKYEAATP